MVRRECLWPWPVPSGATAIVSKSCVPWVEPVPSRAPKPQTPCHVSPLSMFLISGYSFVSPFDSLTNYMGDGYGK
jgi:hypothetical protein